MPTTEVTINNKPLSTMGVAMLSGAYAALLTPPSLKEFVENDDPTQNGIDIIVPDSPVVNERDVTLTFLIKGTSQEAFLSNYAAFVAELHKETVTLYVPDLGNTYNLLYSNSTQFENYRLNACKLAVKFREPNPADRAARE